MDIQAMLTADAVRDYVCKYVTSAEKKSGGMAGLQHDLYECVQTARMYEKGPLSAVMKMFNRLVGRPELVGSFETAHFLLTLPVTLSTREFDRCSLDPATRVVNFKFRGEQHHYNETDYQRFTKRLDHVIVGKHLQHPVTQETRSEARFLEYLGDISYFEYKIFIQRRAVPPQEAARILGRHMKKGRYDELQFVAGKPKVFVPTPPLILYKPWDESKIPQYHKNLRLTIRTYAYLRITLHTAMPIQNFGCSQHRKR